MNSAGSNSTAVRSRVRERFCHRRSPRCGPAGGLALRSNRQAYVGAIAHVEVEGDLGHPPGPRSARLREHEVRQQAYRAPGGALSAPESQAVPAMSRCAHGYFAGEAREEHGGGDRAAARPPTLAMSAKLLFSCSPYSSSSGKRQARSLGALGRRRAVAGRRVSSACEQAV